MATLRTIGIIIAVFANLINGLSYIPQKKAHNRRGEKSYLKDPLWYLGTLMNIVGELGNFVAFALAPAMIVAPLGSIGVISNAFASRIHLKESIPWKAWLGILFCIAGSIGIVFTIPHHVGDGESPTIDSEGTWERIRTLKFTSFIMFDLSAIAVLLPVKTPKSNESVFWYVYLCSVISSMLIVSAKGVATFLLMAINGYAKTVFSSSLFWVMLSWVIGCVMFQGTVFNEGLTKYESSEFIPIYFVLYVLVAMIGSVILYDELDGIHWLALLFFLLSCMSTFLGVFLVSKNRNRRRKKKSGDDDNRRLKLSRLEDLTNLDEYGYDDIQVVIRKEIVMAKVRKVLVNLPKVRCERGHEWVPRVPSPKECPICGSRRIFRA